MLKIQLYRNRVLMQHFTIVDEDVADLLGERRWSIFKPRGSRTLYARSGDIYLHRLVMNAKPGEQLDHINGNGLDNRRSNLRFTTHADNLAAARALKPFAQGPRFASHIQTVRATLADGTVKNYYYDRRLRGLKKERVG